jgi:hypothetical protein
LSASAAPSNRAGSRSVVVSDMARAVGDGVQFRTSFWVSSTRSHSPMSCVSPSRSVAPSPPSILLSCPLSLSTGSSLSCSFAVFEFVVVVVVVVGGAGDVVAVSDLIRFKFGVDVSAGGGRAGVGIGVCTSVFGSGSAGVVTVTGWTFDWVSTDNCTAAP